jgi:uracil-DNA glycosylase
MSLHPSWKPFLQAEFDKPYFQNLSNFLKDAYAHKTIYPQKKFVFSAFATPLDEIKVVILGQDPYHGPNQAHGLAFSVNEQIPAPPSLQNIFKEIQVDLGQPIPKNGNLNRWARQGVLLLNNTLTVEAGKAGSHRGWGWEDFTLQMIKILNERHEHLVFLLWGRDAREKRYYLDQKKHLILEAAHPSPLSAHSGFFGCRHFSKANTYLKQHDRPPIIW